MRGPRRNWKNIFGIEQHPVSHAEKIISLAGGFAGILGILIISRFFAGPASELIVASMGASAVLLFAVPHGALSQPWPVFGGHLVSALVGVSCALLVPDRIIAASLAVGLAIGAMHYLRCIHPPGGATALVAVVGGEGIHNLGYQFVLAPVLLNVVVILAIALLFNYPFPWRRYPAWLAARHRAAEVPASRSEVYSPISHADLVGALARIDSFIDVTEDDLLRIYELATGRARQQRLPLERIQAGHYYSNGLSGEDWSVRHIVDASPGTDPEKDMVVYKVVDGRGRWTTGVQSRSEFAQWARREVLHDGGQWKNAGD